MTEFPVETYIQAVDNHEGYCPECEDFTAEMCEPDAEGRRCPECDSLDVCGAENALLRGLITFSEEV